MYRNERYSLNILGFAAGLRRVHSGGRIVKDIQIVKETDLVAFTPDNIAFVYATV